MAQLTNHVVGSHLRNNAEAAKVVLPAWCSKKQCDLCQKYFSDSKCLKKHVQAVHGKLKPYICHVCNHQGQIQWKKDIQGPPLNSAAVLDLEN